jgi:hypothetical protein
MGPEIARDSVVYQKKRWDTAASGRRDAISVAHADKGKLSAGRGSALNASWTLGLRREPLKSPCAREGIYSASISEAFGPKI